MKVEFELSKYDIMGIASLLGAKQDDFEVIEKYIEENDTLKIDWINEEDEEVGIKGALSTLACTQIFKNLKF